MEFDARRLLDDVNIMIKGLKMARFDNTQQRTDAHKVNPPTRKTRRGGTFGQTRGFAISVAIVLSACASTATAQYPRQTPYRPPQVGASQPYPQSYQQSSTRQTQYMSQHPQQSPSGAPNASQRAPILSGLFNSLKPQGTTSAQPQGSQHAPAPNMTRQEQEPQRLGLFGNQPLIPSLKDMTSRTTQERPSTQENYRQHQYASSHTRNSQGNQTSSGATLSAATLAQASSNPQEAQEALSKVPWSLFPAKTRERLEQLASAPTMYRRLPMAGGRCNPELFDYFLTYPNAVVELWKQMGYDEIDMKQLGPNVYAVSEKGGSNGKISILYQSAEIAVAHVSGVYRGAGLIRPVEGEAFLILQTRYTEDATHKPLVVCRLDAFVDIKNPGVDLVARTFNSMVGKIADTNFTQTLAFIDSVSQTAEQDPQLFQSVAAQLRGLSPEARRILAAKGFEVAQQAQRRLRGEIVDYQLLAKVNDPNPGYARLLSRGGANATNVARQTSTPLHGASPYDSSLTDPSFARSGVHSSIGKPFDTTRDFSLNDDFVLDDSDFDSGLEWEEDGGSIMTGEEFLATRSSNPSPLSSETTSLAKVGAKAPTNARALNLLAEEETDPDALPLVDTSRTVSTDEPIVADDSSFALGGDEEELEFVVNDSFAVELDELNEEESAPVAIPLSTKPTRLPSTLPSTLAQRRPATLNVAPLANVESAAKESQEEIAEITFGEDGTPILEFTLDEEEDATDESVDAEMEIATPLLSEVDDSDIALALPTPDAIELTLDEIVLEEDETQEIAVDATLPTSSEPADAYAETAESPAEEFSDGGWTRSALANQQIAKKTRSSAQQRVESESEEPVATPTKPVTRRYAPPLKTDNRSKDVKTFQEAEKAQSDKTPEDGKRVATYRWTPVPGTFVAKTAAIDTNENTLQPKVATFEKPELH